MDEISASNQESVRKESRMHKKKISMPRITHVGKSAKNSKGPAKKIGKEK